MSYSGLGIATEWGSSSIDFDTNYGGVRIRVSQTPLEDTFSKVTYDDVNYYNYYREIEGRLSLVVEGPTTSGILAMVRKLEGICDEAESYFEGKSTKPVYFTFNEFSFTTVLKKAELEVTGSVSDIERLKKFPLTIRYVRQGLTGQILGGSESARKYVPNTVSGIFPNANHEIDYPTPAYFILYNQRKIFPSGYLLFAENERLLRVFQGINLGTLDEAAINWHNTNSGSSNSLSGTGSLTFIASGIVQEYTSPGRLEIGGSTGFGMPTSEVDIYAAIKTTVPSTTWTIKAFTDNGNLSQLNGPSVETDPITIPYTQYPTIYYLGKIIAPALLGEGSIRLKITPSQASGILYLDHIVIHDSRYLTSRSLQIDGFIDTDVTASGNFELNIKNNYFPFITTDYVTVDNTFMFAHHTDSLKKTTVTYKGNAFLFMGEQAEYSVLDPVDVVGGTGRSSLFTTLLATGSTASGIAGNSWRWADAAGLPTLYSVRFNQIINATKSFFSNL